jgi:eukaryotic-like serine/threonine-protein kinase
MTEDRLKVGEKFLEYRLTSLLDRGGMGEVYEAVDEFSDDTVAIKCLPRYQTTRQDFVTRFRQECRFYPKLKHPNIVRMRRAGIVEDGPEERRGMVYIVMDRLEGRTLRKLLTRVRRLDILNTLHVMIQVADAMAYAHSKGIWHRDLKPENLMIGTHEETRGHVWVLDFGIAKFADARVNTDDLPPLGTFRYMSPEQVERKKPDGRADIYAFGITFYEVLTGRHPFLDDDDPSADPPTPAQIMSGHLYAEPTPPHELIPDCPETVTEVVFRCLAKDREARYATFDRVADDLRALIRASVPPAHPLAKRMLQESAKKAREKAFSQVDFEPPPAVAIAAAADTTSAGAGEDDGARVTAELVGYVVPPSPLPFRARSLVSYPAYPSAPKFGAPPADTAPLPDLRSAWLPPPSSSFSAVAASGVSAMAARRLGDGGTGSTERLVPLAMPWTAAAPTLASATAPALTRSRFSTRPATRPATPLAYARAPAASATPQRLRAARRRTYLLASVAVGALAASATLAGVSIHALRAQRSPAEAAAVSQTDPAPLAQASAWVPTDRTPLAQASAWVPTDRTPLAQASAWVPTDRTPPGKGVSVGPDQPDPPSERPSASVPTSPIPLGQAAASVSTSPPSPRPGLRGGPDLAASPLEGAHASVSSPPPPSGQRARPVPTAARLPADFIGIPDPEPPARKPTKAQPSAPAARPRAQAPELLFDFDRSAAPKSAAAKKSERR